MRLGSLFIPVQIACQWAAFTMGNPRAMRLAHCDNQRMELIEQASPHRFRIIRKSLACQLHERFVSSPVPAWNWNNQPMPLGNPAQILIAHRNCMAQGI